MCNDTTDTQISHIFFKGIVETSMKLVPSKITSTRFSQPWVTRTCKRSYRRKKRTYNRARTTGFQSDWDIFKTVTKESRLQQVFAWLYFTTKNNLKTFFSKRVTPIAPTRDKKFILMTKQKLPY